jgi:hypothetical protein
MDLATPVSSHQARPHRLSSLPSSRPPSDCCRRTFERRSSRCKGLARARMKGWLGFCVVKLVCRWVQKPCGCFSGLVSRANQSTRRIADLSALPQPSLHFTSSHHSRPHRSEPSKCAHRNRLVQLAAPSPPPPIPPQSPLPHHAGLPFLPIPRVSGRAGRIRCARCQALELRVSNGKESDECERETWPPSSSRERGFWT